MVITPRFPLTLRKIGQRSPLLLNMDFQRDSSGPLLARTLLALVLCCLLGACASRRPDLQRLYASAAFRPGQPPVILLHGMLAGKLRDQHSGEEIWPGSGGKFLVRDFHRLKLTLDPVTLEPIVQDEAFGITDRLFGQDFYHAILDNLEQAGGYTRAEPGQPVTDGRARLYVFAYDWRLDQADNAAHLADFIERVRADYDDPELKVDLIAHSMGALIARYYLRYGKVDVLGDNEFPVNNYGAERVRRAILLGAPNLGSVDALHGFIDGFNLGPRRIPTEVFLTMPGLYQLFPHPLNDWLISPDGEPIDYDLFDVEVWRRFHWSLFDQRVRARIQREFEDPKQAEQYLALLERYFDKTLERARRFVWSLTVPLEQVQTRLIIFGGDCKLTPARILIETIDGTSHIRLRPNEIENPVPGIDYDRLMLEPGDGKVTKASLLARPDLDPSIPRHQYSFFPMDYSVFLCVNHNKLARNINFQDNLLHALLSRDAAH